MSNPFKNLEQRSPRASNTQDGQRKADLAFAGLFYRTQSVATLTFSGQLADGETVTYTTGDGEAFVFEADDDGIVAAGNYPVDITGNASAADDILDLATAILLVFGALPTPLAFPSNQSGQATPQLVLYSAGPRTVGSSLATDAANVTVAQPTGDVPHGSPHIQVQQRQPTAAEVTNGFMHFAAPFSSGITGWQVTVLDASLQPVAWDGAVVNNGLGITIDNSGSTDWAATDHVGVLIYGQNTDWETNQVAD